MSPPAPAASPAPLPPQTGSSENGRARRTWTAGTLTYTGGGLIALFAWLLWGDFAWSMKDRAVVPVAQLMLREFGSSDFLVGLLVGSLPAGLGLILGPIISVRSDKHRGRWGRRIPYLLIPTPIVALSMIGLAFTAPLGAGLHDLLGANSPGEMGCRLIVFSFFWTAFEIFQTIAQAVFGGLINDVVPREVVGRFFGLFRAVSLIAGMIFNFWIIGSAEKHYLEIFLTLGILFGVGFTLMCFMVKEGDYPPPPPAPVNGGVLRRRVVDPVRAYAKECFTIPYYLWVFSALMLGGLAAGPVNAFSVFYARSIGMSMDYYGKLLVITYACSLCMAYFLGWMADRFHPLRLGFVVLAGYAVFMLWSGWAVTDNLTFSIAFVAHGVLSGTYGTATASIGQRLFPSQKFAQFSSAAGILGAFGFVVMPPLLGWLLDRTGHAYRYTFYMSGLLGLAGAIGYYVVLRKFLRLGGDRDYQAPV